MREVTMRELRSHGGEVIRRVERGERLIVTRGGRPVAELGPIGHEALTAETLLSRWRKLPPLSPGTLRADLDDVIDAGLWLTETL